MTALPSTEALARLAKAIPEGPWLSVQNHPTNACAHVLQDADWAIEIATLYGNHDDVPSPKDGDPWGDMPVRDATAEAIALLPALLREVLDRREAEDWRDISTAPLTGDRVLVWRPTMCGGKGHIGVAYWASDPYAKNSRPFWSSVEGYISKTENRAHPPTHWRPLPTPPSAPTTEASHGE